MAGIISLPLSFFVDKLNNQEPFAFARYGDGEMECILNHTGENCDHHAYFPELGADLRQTLTEPREYMYAIGPKALRKDSTGPAVKEWVAKYCPQLKWYSSETLLLASLSGQLQPLIESMRKRLVMIVGPSHLRKLAALDFKPASFVETPLQNAYLVKDEIEHKIMRNAYAADVIAFSAGMTTKVLMWELYPHLGATHTLLDTGSLFDMYVGVNSRSYARRLSVDNKQQLALENFGTVRIAA